MKEAALKQKEATLDGFEEIPGLAGNTFRPFLKFVQAPNPSLYNKIIRRLESLEAHLRRVYELAKAAEDNSTCQHIALILYQEYFPSAEEGEFKACIKKFISKMDELAQNRPEDMEISKAINKFKSVF